MKSLVIASAPRSASTIMYRAARKALRHELQSDYPAPADTSGEVLQHVLVPEVRLDASAFEISMNFFNTHAEGYLWKHAGNPWTFLKGLESSAHNVLYLHRNPADCIYSLMHQNWIWPALILEHPEDVAALYDRCLQSPVSEIQMLEILPRVVDGVIAIQKLYQEVSDVTAHWDQATEDPGYFFKVLEDMGYNPHWHDYTSEDFRAHRAALMARRDTPLWSIIEKTCWIRGGDAYERAKERLKSMEHM